MKEIFIVAENELRDYLTGKRFLILVCIMLLLALVGIITGLQDYNAQLNQYKVQLNQQMKTPGWQQMIDSQQQQIADMKARGESQATIDTMQDSLDAMLNPPLPSYLTVFNRFNQAFTFVGVILALMMGFDLISGERESGTLRMLLSRPTYRDSVINGKALAGIIVIAIVLAAMFLVTMAVLLLSQITPEGDDLARIIAYFFATLLFMVAVFAISLLVSTASRSSKTALLIMLCLFVFMYVLGDFTNAATQAVMGPSPAFTQQSMTIPTPGADGSAESGPQDPQQAREDVVSASARYYQTQQQITDMVAFLSPIDSYESLTAAILSKKKLFTPADMFSDAMSGIMYMDMQKEIPLSRSMQNKWGNVIALLAVVVAAFGISYLAFMRSDVT